MDDDSPRAGNVAPPSRDSPESFSEEPVWKAISYIPFSANMGYVGLGRAFIDYVLQSHFSTYLHELRTRGVEKVTIHFIGRFSEISDFERPHLAGAKSLAQIRKNETLDRWLTQ